MKADYDYHINIGELPEHFDESSVDDFIANLNDRIEPAKDRGVLSI